MSSEQPRKPDPCRGAFPIYCHDLIENKQGYPVGERRFMIVELRSIEVYEEWEERALQLRNYALAISGQPTFLLQHEAWDKWLKSAYSFKRRYGSYWVPPDIRNTVNIIRTRIQSKAAIDFGMCPLFREWVDPPPVPPAAAALPPPPPAPSSAAGADAASAQATVAIAPAVAKAAADGNKKRKKRTADGNEQRTDDGEKERDVVKVEQD